MKLLFIPVIVLVMALPGGMPACAGESRSMVAGENTSSSFFVTMDPIGDQYSGDPVLMQGSTNIPVTEMLRVKVYSSSNHYNRNKVIYEISRTVPIVTGENGINRWSVEMTMSNWSPDEYLATAFPDSDTDTHDRGYAGVVFNLFAADKRPGETLKTAGTALPFLPVQENVPVTPPLPAPTRPVSLSTMVTITATGAMLIVSGIKRERGR